MKVNRTFILKDNDERNKFANLKYIFDENLKKKDIIIIDDPFENLDFSGKQFVYNLLVSYKKTEKTIICFSNDKEILNIADQRYSLDE